MKIKISRKPLIKRSFARDHKRLGIHTEGDFRIGGSRLKCKVLVFMDRAVMEQFCHEQNILRPPGVCVGLTDSLHYVVSDRHGIHLLYDKDYVALVMLCMGYVSADTIAHESTHVAFAYYKRVKRKKRWDDAISTPDENICYPTGIVCHAINKILHRTGAYEVDKTVATKMEEIMKTSARNTDFQFLQVGCQFGRLKVTERFFGKRGALWLKCKCECGKIVTAKASTFSQGIKSCGCGAIQRLIQARKQKRAQHE